MRPDFFIVGAPKSGTTSFAAWLRQHPDVFIPRRELHYFGRDLDLRRDILALDDYLAHFAGGQDAKCMGDKSVSYLYSRRAPQEIKEFNRRAQILVLLRNPVDMLYSLHAHLVREGAENIHEFADAWRAESDRRQGRNMPENSPARAFLFYRTMGSYFEPVSRFMNVFNDRMKVYVFEHLINDPSPIYKDCLKFLQVDPSVDVEFSHENKGRIVRNQFVHGVLVRILRRPPKTVRRLARYMIPWSIREGLRTTPIQATLAKGKRPPLDPEIEEEVRMELRDDVVRLSELLGTDLEELWFNES